MGTPSDRAQILALEKGLNAGLNAKDPTKVVSDFAREGLFIFAVGLHASMWAGAGATG